MKNKISVLPNKTDEYSNKLIQGIIDYIENNIKNKGINIKSIGLAITTTEDNSIMTFNGSDLMGLSAVLSQLQFRINKMINSYSETNDFEYEFETE